MAYLENLMEHILGVVFFQAASAALCFRYLKWPGLIGSLLSSSVFWSLK